jgi:hypothetical protein
VSLYYQYLSSSDAITDLERGMVKVSRIKTVNDMFELQPYLRVDKDKRKQFERIRKKVADTYGMVCFSTDWQEPIMWAHYADRNKGIVLGFDFISSRFIMRQVRYPPKRKKVSLDPKTVTASEYIEAVGFIKYKGWSYEREHRFFVRLHDCVPIQQDYFVAFASDLRLRQVIIGPEHASKNKKDYIQKARWIAGLAKDKGAELIVARAEFGGYRVVRCGYWTPKFEKLLA